jgi:predicted nuclease of predicted toxin-antitoxin system
VAEVLSATAPDDEILGYACRERRVLVTRDLDFGRLLHLSSFAGAAVVILRIGKGELERVHTELAAALKAHSAAQLADSVVIVEAGRHRIRRLAPSLDQE